MVGCSTLKNQEAAVIRKIAETLHRLSVSPLHHLKTCFDSKSPPPINLFDYVERLWKHMDCSIQCFVISISYIQRILRTHSGIRVGLLNVHTLTLSSLVVAAKFHDDSFRTNAHYAYVGGVSATHLHDLEIAFMKLLDWRATITKKDFCCCLDLLFSENQQTTMQDQRALEVFIAIQSIDVSNTSPDDTRQEPPSSEPSARTQPRAAPKKKGSEKLRAPEQGEASEWKSKDNELHKKKQFKEAIEMYNKAIERMPNGNNYQNTKCTVLIETGPDNYDKVVDTCKDLRYEVSSVILDSASHENQLRVIHRRSDPVVLDTAAIGAAGSDTSCQDSIVEVVATNSISQTICEQDNFHQHCELSL